MLSVVWLYPAKAYPSMSHQLIQNTLEDININCQVRNVKNGFTEEDFHWSKLHLHDKILWKALCINVSVVLLVVVANVVLKIRVI